MKKGLLIFAAVLLGFSGCSDKKKYEKAVFIFEKHGIKKIDASKIRNLLNQKGFAGLKEVDRYAALVSSKRKVKFYGSDKEMKNVGVLFDGTPGNVYARRVFKDSPAFRKDIRDLDKVLSYGYAKTPDNKKNIVEFKFQRGLAKKPLFISVRKEEFVFPKIFGFPVARDTAYVKISSFFKGSSEILEKGLSDLAKGGVRFIILDLRYNAGGSMEELSRSINLFCPIGKLIFSVKSERPGYTKDFYSSFTGKFLKTGLTVLVNKDTAMAGEIFARALKENNGAVVMGTSTAGKVSIQKTFKFSRGKGLSITVAKLFPSSGFDMEGKGVDIDIKVDVDAEKEKQLKDMWFTGSSIVLMRDTYYKKAVARSKRIARQ